MIENVHCPVYNPSAWPSHNRIARSAKLHDYLVECGDRRGILYNVGYQKSRGPRNYSPSLDRLVSSELDQRDPSPIPKYPNRCTWQDQIPETLLLCLRGEASSGCLNLGPSEPMLWRLYVTMLTLLMGNFFWWTSKKLSPPIEAVKNNTH